MSKSKPPAARPAADSADRAPTPSAGRSASSGPGDSPPASGMVVFRETIESIVVAFVLAFFIRTFEAEAFVIPTGSMSPSLQGRHKDVHCAECGYRFRTSASTEDPEEARRHGMTPRQGETIGGMCPMCRYPMPFTPDLPESVRGEVAPIADLDAAPVLGSYPGDRILVNKYGYDFGEPQRWDVVVFKFPGDGNMNYIKRLVGLSGEELRIYQGDVFARPLGSQEDFRILRKPADKALAMLQTVHDTDYESASLYRAGWPLRWRPLAGSAWQVAAEKPQAEDQTVEVSYRIEPTDEANWLRYRHIVAETTDDWTLARAIVEDGSLDELARREGVSPEQAQRDWNERMAPQLITDFNAYNAGIMRFQAESPVARWSMESLERMPNGHLGLNWVSDLGVEFDVEIAEPKGQLLVDLVEAGCHFEAAVDLSTGKVNVRARDARRNEPLDFAAEGQTSLDAGQHTVRMANVDDEILLWVDGEPVELSGARYDADKLFAGGRRQMLPWADPDLAGDAGDLAPVGVGARGAKLRIDRLKVLRDQYYIATDQHQTEDARQMDYDPWRLATTAGGQPVPPLNSAHELLARAEAWPRFLTRRHVDFDVKPGQLFVLGDNSPESADCRLWASNSAARGIPGGPYLDRRLLIGKAVCVFWPHSWGSVPLLPRLPGLPNFKDMRLVR